MGPQTTDIKDMSNGREEDDDSVADTTNTDERETRKRSVAPTSEDKNVVRSKFAAFVILALAALGLGTMTFLLTRNEELRDFEDQVSH